MSCSRRQLLALAGGALLAADATPVRIGFIGTGRRGTSLLQSLLTLPGVEVPALCDVSESAAAQTSQVLTRLGRPAPQQYTRGPEDYRRLLDRPDLTAVINATPWDLHARVSVAALKAGKVVGAEVPLAVTVDECWEIVETSERTKVPLMMLENVCYFRNVLLLVNLVERGLLGELVHCEAGYQHDVRFLSLDDQGDLTWRGEFASRWNGNLYPTHPIGPAAWWLNIHRGNRFTYLTSMSSQAAGLPRYAAKRWGANHPAAKRTYAQGDVNTTMLQTASGATVVLYYNTYSPRPYDLIFRVQGTDGVYSGTLDKLFIEPPQPGARPAPEQWQDPAPYYAQHEHTLWKELGETATRYGHGGADYITLHQFVTALRRKAPLPIDVYDSAVWSVIVPLSRQSVAEKSRPVDIPDFTRGRWQQKRPLAFYL